MKKFKLITLFLLTIILTTSCTSKADPNQKISRTGLEIGTVVSITLYDTEDESIMDGAFEILNEIDNEFSLSIESSTLNKINQNASIAPVEINDDITQVIESSLYYSELSDGLFDISIEPLVSLWGIGSENARVPSQDEINSALIKINYNNIVLDKNTVFFDSESTKLDFGAIAKGFAADKIVNYLKDNGINRAIISLGGNVYALGTKSEDSTWRIGIQNPNEDRGDIIGSLSVSDKSVVTSGLYERYFEENGIRYHHILNTSDGYPIDNELLGVSIISDRSIDGDALSTITFILGVDEGMKLIESLDQIDAIFVTKDSKVYSTSGVKTIFKLTNDKFTLVN
ncbi:MAG: FAD:protein FMN transferase [Acidaminobacteraceae bacterium]